LWAAPVRIALGRRVRPNEASVHSGRLLWVGFDRSSVRQQWLVPSAELTFVIGRLL
jgi:hypothetical protein